MAALEGLLARHRERHRPAGFGFAVSDAVAALDAGTWDGLTRRAGFFMSRRYLEVLERAGPANLSPRCVLIRRGPKPVAAVAAQLLDIPAAGALRTRVLVCGNLLSWGQHAAAFAPDEDPAALWPGVAEALYRIRRAERLSGRAAVVLVKDLADGAGLGVEALRRFSYARVSTDPNMVLTLRPEWASFDGYLASLQAKYRSQVNAVSRRLAAAGCTVERLGDVAGNAGRLHALYRQVQAAAPVRPVAVPPGYFPALARAAGEDFRCTVIRRGPDILGFATTLRDGDDAVAYYLGYERALRSELPLYFRLLRCGIDDAIEWRCRRLSMGRTSLAPKAQLGARPVPTSLWLRHANPVLNVLARGLLGAVPHGEAPATSPFKAV